MPIEYADQMYCSQQILIPPTLPLILKKYAKAAIRTQPRDLLLWSLHYFKAVADGLPPPVKERIEYPPVESESGLTPGYLKVLLNQIGTADTVSKDTIIDKWEGICLDRKYAELLFKVGNFPEQVEWIKFVALAAGTLEENLTGTMSLLCELLTEEPEGGSAIVPVETFLSLYKYLAALDCGSRPQDVSDSEEVKSREEIEYGEKKEEQQSEIWDDLLKDVGDDKSTVTIATDDIKDADSRDGLEVWPDLVPNDLKLAEETSEEKIDTNSDIGLQVWDEDQLKQNIEEKEVIVPEGEEDEDEEKEVISNPEEKPTEEIPDNVENDAKEKETKEGVTEEENEDEELAVPTEVSVEAESEAKQEEEEEEEEEEAGEEVEVLPPVATLVEPNPDLVMDPSPVPSQGSICTEEKSIESIGETERETSTGQVLNITTSLEDVRVIRKEVQDDYPKPECPPENDFWVHIPGIGQIVPQPVVEEVEVYLRQCAAKQCDMVMPRNLRHFLCPPIDGIAPEEITVPKPECDECAEEDKTERAKKLLVIEGKHVIF